MKAKVKKRSFEHSKATNTAPLAPHPVETAPIDEPVHEQINTAMQAKAEPTSAVTCQSESGSAHPQNQAPEPVEEYCVATSVPTPEDTNALPTSVAEHDAHTLEQNTSEHTVHEQSIDPPAQPKTTLFSNNILTEPESSTGSDPIQMIEAVETHASGAAMVANPSDESSPEPSNILPQPDLTENERLEPLPHAAVTPPLQAEKAAATPDHSQDSSSEPAPSCVAQGTHPTSCSLWARGFDMLTYVAPLVIIAVCAAQFIPGIWLRPSSPVVEHWIALLDLVNAAGKPVYLMIDGLPAVAYSPAYAVLLNVLAGLGYMLGYTITPHMLLFGGSALFAAVFALGVWGLSMATCNNRRVALASSVVAMASYPFIMAGHEASLNMAATACLVMSMMCLYLGWMRTRAIVLLALGFLLAACAAVLGNLAGALGLLIGSLLFLFWRGVFRRAGARDGAFGFAIFLVLLLGWLVYMGLGEGGKAFSAAYKAYMLADVWALPNLEALADHGNPLLVLACMLLPWLLALPLLPWEKTPTALLGIWTNRQHAPGIGWLWCCTLALAGLALCSWPRSNDALLALAPLGAVLTGRTIMAFSPLRSQLFFALSGLLLVLATLTLSFVAALPLLSSWIPDIVYEQAVALSAPLRDLPGLWWLAGICAVFAFVLLSLTNKRFPAAGLFVSLLFAMAIPQPLNVMIEPSQSAIVEPPAATMPTPGKASEEPSEGNSVPQEELPQPAEVPQTNATQSTNAHNEEIHPPLAPATNPPASPEAFAPVPQEDTAQAAEPAQSQKDMTEAQENPAATVLPANEGS